MLDVTTWYREQAHSRVPASIVRQFTLGDSDYSERVMRWPTVKQSWDDIRPMAFTVRLANDDGGMNFIRDDKVIMRNPVAFNFGFTHPDSGDETVTMFSGTVERVRYVNGTCEIVTTDKFKQLSERIMGDNDNPVDLTTSDYLPSDIAWYAITSWGGYDSTQDSSNQDIHWPAFAEWAEIFSADNITMHGYFDGQKVTEVLRRIARSTMSGIFVQDDKINFNRFSIADTLVTSLTAEHIGQTIVEFNDAETVNKQYVGADYRGSDPSFQVNVVSVDSDSVNSYGAREHMERDEMVYYTDSASALNFAQRKVLIYGKPFDEFKVMTFLHGSPYSIGDVLTHTDSFFGIDTEGGRIMEKSFDMTRGRSELKVDRSQLYNAFHCNCSQLNGTDVLT